MKRINIQETVDFKVPIEGLDLQESVAVLEKEEKKTSLPEKLNVVVEAIHSGLTKNYTFYPADNLEKSAESWTRDYHKPVIKNHDIHEEPVGRVKSANFKQSNLAPDKHTIELELEITDPEAIKKVMDGRYHTMSIGGSTSSAVCSVCGKDLVREGYCGHMKGRTYEGKKAHWIIGEMDFDEISWVNVPADKYSQVVSKTSVQQTESVSTEGGEGMDVTKQSEDILDQIDTLRGNVSESTEETNPEVPVSENETTETDTPETPEHQEEGVEETTETPESTEPTLQEQLDAANDRIKTLESENTTLTAENSTLEEQVKTLKGEKTTLQDEVQKLKDELNVSEDENKGLVKQNVTLASYAHRALAESVANMQFVLGKIEEGKLEETVAGLTKQTSRALKEQINGLVSEKPQRIVQTVDRSLINGEDADGDVTESTADEKKELSLQEFAEKLNRAFNKNYSNDN